MDYLKRQGFALSALVALAGALCGAVHAEPFAYIRTLTSLTVIDVADHRVVAEIPGLYSPAATPGSPLVYASNAKGLVAVDSRTNLPIASWPVALIERFAVSPTEPIAYAVEENWFMSPSSSVRVISTRSGAVIRSFGITPNVRDLAFTRDGRLLLVATQRELLLIDPATSGRLGQVALAGWPRAVVPHPGGELAFVITDAGVETVHLPSLARVGTISLEEVVHAALDIEGRRLFVSHQYASGDRLSVIDVATQRVIATPPACEGPAGANGLDVTPDGRFIYLLCAGKLRVLSTANYEPVADIPLAPSERGRGRFIGGVAPPAAGTKPGPVTGLWWNPREPGWGIHLAERQGTTFAVLFHYDHAAQARWLVASDCARVPGDGRTCRGALYEARSRSLFANDLRPFTTREAGTLEIALQDDDHAMLDYVVDGQRRRVAIERQRFAPSTPLPLDHTDLWWNPTDPGWGVGITRQSDVLFVTWFTHGEDGKPIWYVASRCQVLAAGNGCRGAVYLAQGARGPAPAAFDPSALLLMEVGTVELLFDQTDLITLNYTIQGYQGSRKITRQLFPAPAAPF